MYSNYLLVVFVFFGTFAGTTSAIAQESQWDSNFNRMYLSQQGSKISGSYDYQGGKITADIVGKELRGWWTENDDVHNCGPNKRWSGPFVLVFAQDMKSFTGRYGKCSKGVTDFNGLWRGGDWHGTLISGALRLNSQVSAPVKVISSGTTSTALPKKPVPAPTIMSSKISLVPEKSSFRPEQKITVSFSGFPARGQDWIALSSTTHKSDEYFEMVMLEGKPHSGSHSFSGLPAGNYELRVYTNWPDGGYKIATKASISVAKAAAMPKPPIRLTSPKSPVSPTPGSGSIMDTDSISEMEPVDYLENEPEHETPSETSIDMAQQKNINETAAGNQRALDCFDLGQGQDSCVQACQSDDFKKKHKSRISRKEGWAEVALDSCLSGCASSKTDYIKASALFDDYKDTKFLCPMVLQKVEAAIVKHGRSKPKNGALGILKKNTFGYGQLAFRDGAFIGPKDRSAKYADEVVLVQLKNTPKVEAILAEFPERLAGCYNTSGAVKKCTTRCDNGKWTKIPQDEGRDLCVQGCQQGEQLLRDKYVWTNKFQDKGKYVKDSNVCRNIMDRDMPIYELRAKAKAQKIPYPQAQAIQEGVMVYMSEAEKAEQK